MCYLLVPQMMDQVGRQVFARLIGSIGGFPFYILGEDFSPLSCLEL